MRPWFAMSVSARIALSATTLMLGACSPAALSSSGPIAGLASPASASPTSARPSASVATSPSVIASPVAVDAWNVVAVGDSIPFNSPDDCPGCTGFVQGYADRLQEATGHPVLATNLSQHNGLQASGLSPEVVGDKRMRAALADADVVIVSIGHNDTPWNATDDACDGARQWDDPIESNIPSALKYSRACAKASAEAYQPLLASIYRGIAELRAGKPTVLLALNTYNDILGWCELRGCNGPDKTPVALNRAATLALDAWNAMICKTASAEGFACADVYHLFGGKKANKPAGDLLARDYTHPSQAGNDRIADYLLSLGYEALQP